MRLGHRLIRWKGGVSFENLKRYKEIQGFFKNSFFPRYLWIAALAHLPGGERNRFTPFLRQMLNWQKATTPEWDFAQKSLSCQKSRLRGIQLRVTTGLDRYLDYIVFEVFPSENWRSFIIRKPLRPEYEVVFPPDFDPKNDLPF